VKREPEVKALRSFHAIVRTGSVTAAAREMGLTQPSVSRILAQLEADLGFELFYRDRGRLVPSADGLQLFKEVDLALRQMDRIAMAVSDIATLRTGELKIVAPPSFSEGVLPDIVTDFLAEHPLVRLTIDSRSVETAKSLIATRAVDLGFVKLPVDRPDLRLTRIMTSRIVCVMSSAHRLAPRRELGPAPLKDEPLILLGLGRASRTQIEAAFVEAGVTPLVRVETHTIASACALAARGVGIALVNERLARPYLRVNELEARSFKPKLVQEYAAATSALTDPSRLAATFLDHARRYFEQT
jgi:DNA-binding transcriptional LysR family regulator